MSEFPAADTRIIEGEELIGLLPHKGKMLLISRVTEYDVPMRSLRSEYDIGENCLFFDPVQKGVPAWMSFEFMAQAVSALSGITGRVMGKPPMMGFILSVSSLEIKVPLFKTGALVRIHVLEELRVDTVSTFRCTVWDGETEAVTAKIMVMDVEDPQAFGGQ
jgi:predicted hotdog family 3-hydroxylacyl-ACP dehydratase